MPPSLSTASEENEVNPHLTFRSLINNQQMKEAF